MHFLMDQTARVKTVKGILSVPSPHTETISITRHDKYEYCIRLVHSVVNVQLFNDQQVLIRNTKCALYGLSSIRTREMRESGAGTAAKVVKYE